MMRRVPRSLLHNTVRKMTYTTVVPVVRREGLGSTESLLKFPSFSLSSVRFHSQTIKIRFLEESSDSVIEVDAPVGKRVLDAALDNNIDIEGACGGELACSTCHVVLDQVLYDKLPAKKEEEQDMLDLAWGVTDT
jgi:ferredoxin